VGWLSLMTAPRAGKRLGRVERTRSWGRRYTQRVWIAEVEGS
jgi:hypothetical protein